MVVGQLIFTAAMLSAVLFVSANLYLMKANSGSPVVVVVAVVEEQQQQQQQQQHSESQQPWHKFGGLFYKSSRSGLLGNISCFVVVVVMVVYIICGVSLSFGWALQTLITVVVAAIVPSGKTTQRPWVVFVVLVIIATAVFFGGRSLYVKFVRSRVDEDPSSTNNNNSAAAEPKVEGSSAVSVTLTTNIKESLV